MTMGEWMGAYLVVALLAPLSWVLVIEACRRTRGSEPEQKTVFSGAGRRVALPIARARRPESTIWC